MLTHYLQLRMHVISKISFLMLPGGIYHNLSLSLFGIAYHNTGVIFINNYIASDSCRIF